MHRFRLLWLIGSIGGCTGFNPTIEGRSPTPPDAALSGDSTVCPVSMYANICAYAPGETMSVDGIDTLDTETDPRCRTLTQPGGPDACLVYSTHIEIRSGAILRAVGVRPLILASSGSIELDGQLDVSSRRGEAPGAGADYTECAHLATPDSDGGGGGGGSGGSFQGIGGDGGRGDTDQSSGGVGDAAPGRAGAAVASPSFVRGGCRGQDGGDGDLALRGGQGGSSGGGVLIIADELRMTGSIRATGAGGGGGDSQSGGGGGGSGGYVIIEAATLEHRGEISANSGAGGEGGNRHNGIDIAGNHGSDGGFGAAAAAGSGATPLGGPGGDGSANEALLGNNGGSSTVGAGGGGGGAGYVVLSGAVAGDGTTSPPALP